MQRSSKQILRDAYASLAQREDCSSLVLDETTLELDNRTKNPMHRRSYVHIPFPKH
uniref:Uncharacterized protein n=1 Tax=Anguilla anguilla TaxID=7936 RepID=A0A0E9WXW3_ANGAN